VTIPEAYPVTVPITALEFSRDGSTIAASGYHEVTFWKMADGKLDHRLRGLAERVYAIVTSPDGKWLATASGDPGIYGVAKLWLAEPSGGGKPVRDLVETQDVVFAVAFSPDSKKIATAGADRTIRILEVETGKLLAQIEDHADWVFSIAFSPDGKRLASASRDKTAKVFDLEKKESLVTFPGHAQPVYTVSFTPDGKGVATGGEDNHIRIWNPDNDGKSIRDIGGFGGTVFLLRYAPDGQSLLACGADKSVSIYKANGTQIRRLQGHRDWVYSLAISRDGKTIASGSWDGEVRLWNAADGKLLRTIIAAPGYKPIGAQAAAR
jgi:WD40 repeat protein